MFQILKDRSVPDVVLRTLQQMISINSKETSAKPLETNRKSTSKNSKKKNNNNFDMGTLDYTDVLNFCSTRRSAVQEDVCWYKQFLFFTNPTSILYSIFAITLETH